ncbi:hypothetical protein ASC77_11535 [Nocardioides sp. Root1257]|uniref:MarR family winged helix-turn-helix transcriptional regulator n=1 Tax=unclassified Nocardioides TaxID=2615069 RepID=UPI0006FC8D7F|nr:MULTISPECIES: MarR family transcriptional regulator [unclassified Nocardioides]KQW49307.1 hypothetical protein ASC77_11535 [Nocardioides sp. Root1257]KRC48481.1 hypothetical protein ASE24_11540 [Nocardioides sp. Root224]
MTDPTQPPADEPWLDAEQQRQWRSLVAMLMTLPAALDAQLKRDTGLNMFEYHVLAALSEEPTGALPMSELAVMSRGSRSRLSHAVSRLEGAGWVERRSCAGAGLRTAAHLTETGRRKLEESAPGHVREARRLVVDQLSPAQLEALGTTARAILRLTAPELTDEELAQCTGSELEDEISSAAG